MPLRHVQALLLASILAAAAALAPLAGAHAGPHEGKESKDRTYQVSLTSYKFSPDYVKDLHAKDTIVFKNRDKAPHRLKGAGLDSGDIKPTSTWTWSPQEVGNVTFLCTYHPRMKLALNVLPERPPNHAPTAKIESPSDGEKVAGIITVKVDAKDEDANLASVRVRLGGGEWRRAEAPNPWKVRIDTAKFLDGEALLEAAAVDGDGEYSPIDVIRVVIANAEVKAARDEGSSPTSSDGLITISAPTAGTTIRGSFFVQGTARPFEDGQTTKARLRVDGGPWMIAEGLSAWRYNLNTLNLTDGVHTIEATAWDGTRTSSIASVRVVVGNLDPTRLTVRIMSPGDGANVGGKVGISGDLGGPALSNAVVLVRIDGGPWTAAEGVNPWSAKWDAGVAPSGRHVIEAVARAGEKSSNLARVVVYSVPSDPIAPAPRPAEAATAGGMEKPIPAPALAFTLAVAGLAAWAAARRRP